MCCLSVRLLFTAMCWPEEELLTAAVRRGCCAIAWADCVFASEHCLQRGQSTLSQNALADRTKLCLANSRWIQRQLEVSSVHGRLTQRDDFWYICNTNTDLLRHYGHQKMVTELSCHWVLKKSASYLCPLPSVGCGLPPSFPLSFPASPFLTSLSPLFPLCSIKTAL